MAKTSLSRRHFFLGGLLAGAVPAAGYGSTPSLRSLGYKSPNERLNVVGIGAGGKGRTDIREVAATENIVALVDPDEERAAETYEKHPDAEKFTDFRRMFDKLESQIDAVVISTPDHMHGMIAHWAMQRGKHVYCQKPLTRTIWEARELAKAADKYNVATQMGNQGYSNDGARECCEIIWSGLIGDVTEVHAWTNRPIWPQGLEEPPPTAPVPSTMDWDSWLGIADDRPYSPEIAPFAWRGFVEYGCGALGDMACHILGTPNMALNLAAPTSVECLKQEGVSRHSFPQRAVFRFEFPARATMPPVTVYWYDGMEAQPELEGVPAGENIGQGKNGAIFMGSEGMLTTGTYGSFAWLIPSSQMKDYEPPPQFLTRSPGHYRDWIRAAKGGEPACSSFAVAGPFTEWILLGVIAMQHKGKLKWDSGKMEITNNRKANRMIKPTFRDGWTSTGSASMIRTQIRIERADYEAAQEEARRLGISVAEFVRRAVRDKLEVDLSRPWMRFAGLVESGDPEPGSSVDDTVYGSRD